MLLDIVLIVIGVAMVLYGADKLTEGASALSRRMNVSEIIIGSSKLDDAGTYYVAMTDSMAKEFGFSLHSSGFVAAGRSIAGIVSDYISDGK